MTAQAAQNKNQKKHTPLTYPFEVVLDAFSAQNAQDAQRGSGIQSQFMK
jgi:hypothetical protein